MKINPSQPWQGNSSKSDDPLHTTVDCVLDIARTLSHSSPAPKHPSCRPFTLDRAETLISNLDGRVSEDARDALTRGFAVEHSGWDHWGLVWLESGTYREYVMVYQKHINTLSADSLDELLNQVNDRFGWD